MRTYDGRALGAEVMRQIERIMAEARKPFGGKVDMTIAGVDQAEFSPSTYGLIRGARSWMLLGYGDDEKSCLSAGYAMEQVVLQAQAMGLSTCWIAGTFRGSRFSSVASFGQETPLKVVIPIGWAATRRGVVERVFRAVAGSDKRIDASKLFVDKSGQPLDKGNKFYEALMLMRLAPSSVNSQPWRAVAYSDRVDFFTTKTDALGYVNMGIGMSHFAVGCEAKGIKGHFELDAKAAFTPKDTTFVASFLVG